MTIILLALAVLAILVLVGAVSIGVVVLIKLGVIGKYAFKKESPDYNAYDLDQSQEAGDE